VPRQPYVDYIITSMRVGVTGFRSSMGTPPDRHPRPSRPSATWGAFFRCRVYSELPDPERGIGHHDPGRPSRRYPLTLRHSPEEPWPRTRTTTRPRRGPASV